MRVRYVIAAIAALGALTTVSPALGGPSPSRLAERALHKAKKADKRARQAKRKARNVSKQTGPQGPAGPRGLRGATGPQGPAGATNVERREAVATIGPTSAGSAIANCDPGEVAVGGGYSRTGNVSNSFVGTSAPELDGSGVPTSWKVSISNLSTTEDHTVTAFVLCASP